MTRESRTSASERRILLIAYHFPPSAAVGGTRVANFARLLPSLGWETRVMTIRDEDVELLDPARLEGLEGIPVRKIRRLPTVTTVYAALRKLRSARTDDPPAKAAPSATHTGSRPGESLWRRVRRYVLSILDFPDFERGWILPAAITAVRLVRKHQIGWIMTSCPPYSGHLVGLIVHVFTGARWVADFRDPWMTTGAKRMYPTSAFSMEIESWLERKVIEKAELALFNVQRLRNAYCMRYSHVPADRFVFLPNAIPLPAHSRTRHRPSTRSSPSRTPGCSTSAGRPSRYATHSPRSSPRARSSPRTCG